MARLWRDGSNPLYRFSLTASHIAALFVIGLISFAIARRETRRAGSNASPSM
jgi:hypothetical protein